MIYILFLRLILVMCLLLVVVSVDPGWPIGRPGCPQSCQNSSVKIPYPFGIGKNCYFNPWYEVVCNSSSGAQKPFLKDLNLEVLKIPSCLGNSDASCVKIFLTMEVASHWQSSCRRTNVANSSQLVSTVDLKGSPFRYSDNNVFLVKGCSAHATVSNHTKTIGGCSTTCRGGNTTTVVQNKSTCDGVGCCSISPTIDDGASDFYQVTFTNQVANSCMEVGLVESSSQDQIVEQLTTVESFPSLLYWDPPGLPGGVSSYMDSKFFCRSFCDGEQVESCIVCTCRDPYQGNPYIPYGCQDPCKVGTDHPGYCKKKKWELVIGVLVCSVLVISLFCCYGLYRFTRTRRQEKRRVNFFKRNGGLLFQQQMTSTDGTIDRTKIFTGSELEKATDNFNANRILGQGGQGTVYKGMLLDGRVVAIKKSKKLDESQLEQFINEVAILSQINHRNIVKLLGCCLDTEVPLLVYEFIPNGTLGHHIHSPSEDFHITWPMRLQIAAESAEALTYLHSYSTTPIYHRDIKSANILLDDKYRAVVSDFGTSRTIEIDQTHLSTCVQGTLGYLDPEFFQTHQFTEKSDVYSFGVVLAELLTGRKPLSPAGSEGWKSVAVEFLAHMETSSLFDIVDSRIVKEAKEEEIEAMAAIAKRCLDLNGKDRPTMKEVASALEGIRSSSLSSEIQDTPPPKEHSGIMDLSTMLHDSNVNSTTFSYSLDIQSLLR